MISAVFEVLAALWGRLLEALWRADRDGKSLERRPARAKAVQQRDEADEAREG